MAPYFFVKLSWKLIFLSRFIHKQSKTGVKFQTLSSGHFDFIRELELDTGLFSMLLFVIVFIFKKS